MTPTPALRLTVPRKIETELKRLAKSAFDRETFAFLLGTVAGDHVHVDELYSPENLLEYSTTCAVRPQPEWWEDARDQARESELHIVGWAHSHPYALHERPRGQLIMDHAQSQADLDCGMPLLISAVCVVQQVKHRGKVTLRASLRYWGVTVPVEVEYS